MIMVTTWTPHQVQRRVRRLVVVQRAVVRGIVCVEFVNVILILEELFMDVSVNVIHGLVLNQGIIHQQILPFL